MPERVEGFEDLLRQSARDSFTKYQAAASPKVFVQGPLGNWSWKSSSSDVSLEEVTELAVEACQKSWRFTNYGSACEAINVNGRWLEK